jgi:hypothetical protein
MKIAILTTLAIASSMTGRAATIFTFDNDNVGTTTTFTDTVNGLSATFSSPSGPGAFTVQQSFFETLTGNVLGSPGPAFLNNVNLTINFSSNLSAINLLFATADFNTPSPFTLTAYEGNTLEGSNTLAGMFLPGFTFPEGEIAFSGATFNTVVLSTTAPNFAIDNVQVAGATPEPAYNWILGLSLSALGAAKWRRQSKP